jgi:hypothetical protein
MYKIYDDGFSKVIITNNNKTSIPVDEANKDYQEYLKWVAEGNEAEEYQPE